MAVHKKRLDELLVDLGYFADTRSALGPIMAGDVVVAGLRITKAGASVAEDAEIVVGGRSLKYASRGGYKLEHALAVFGIDVHGMTVLDAGASTGGFTDCLLQHGAARVFAVDVGYGQLRGRLAADERVVVMEKTNISDLLNQPPDATIDLGTVDLSYLSLATAIPVIREVIGAAELICLVKPLYEGLAESMKADMTAILDVAGDLLTRLSETGFCCSDITVSPVLGGRGAVEFLVRIAAVPQACDVAALVEKLRLDWLAHPPSASP